MKKFLFGKNLISFLVLSLMLAYAAEASTTKVGRLWEYIHDPIFHKGAQTDGVINWMINNFDKDNIPLVGIVKPIIQNTGKISGIDSVYKYARGLSIMRSATWNSFFSNDNATLDLPWATYNPTNLVEGGQLINSILTAGGTNVSGDWFADRKNAIDALEADPDGKGPLLAMLPITELTSQFKDGYVQGNMKLTGYDGPPAGNLHSAFVYNVILVEGYHKYGTEEFYFIPRAALNQSGQVNGDITKFKDSTLEVNFKLHVDKSWNTKYLYVIGLVELYPRYPFVTNMMTRLLADVAVDRVVDLKNIKSHTSLKLGITHKDDATKCSKTALNSTSQIEFNVTNPTASAVKAVVYVDTVTSMFNNWTITKDKDTIDIPANSSQTVTVTAKAPASDAAVAFDLAVLPINTGDNVNPLINNALTVVATDSVAILGIAEHHKQNDLYIPMGSNSWVNNYSIIPLDYCSVLNAELFNAFILSYGSEWQLYQAKNVRLKPATSSVDTNYALLYYINFNLKLDDVKQDISMANVLNEAQVQFLNSVIAKGKHLAVFMDRTATYSTIPGMPGAAGINQLLASFGVSFKEEIYKIHDQQDSVSKPILFEVRGVEGGLANHITSPMNADANVDIARVVTHIVNYNIIAPSTTTKVYDYPDVPNSVAAVRTIKGNSKMFLTGFGLESADPYALTMSGHFKSLFDSLTAWWFGIKPELNPVIKISATELDFGEVFIEDSAMLEVVVENTATNPADYLEIKPVSGLRYDNDNSFEVVKELRTRIDIGQKDTLIFKFKPTNQKDYTNVVYTLYSNATNASQIDIKLLGKGAHPYNPNPQIHVQAELLEHDFGDLTVDETGANRPDVSYTITNIGNEPLEITSISYSDATDKEVFSFRGNSNTTAAKTLEKNTSTSFIARFTAKKIGEFNGTIEVRSNDPETPVLELKLKANVVLSIKEQIARVFNCNVSPLPANNFINIDFNVIGELPHNVTLNIVDQTGRAIETIVNEQLLPGNYKRQIDIKSLANGTYFIEYVVDNMRSATAFSVAR